MAVYKYGQAAKTTLPTATATAEQTAAPQQDNGGFLGGIGYVAEKAGLGFLSTFEGVWDYAAGGIASMFGNNEWAEQQFKNDWVDYSHPDTWYQPSDGWKTAGDVFSGIGNSAANLVPYGIAAAVTYFSGGTLAPVAAAIVKGGAIGSSIALAGVGAAGQSTKQAYQETGKLGQAEYGYGALSGATEGLLEGATNLIGFGSGAVAKSLSRAAAKEAAETVAKETIGKTLIKGFAGEAFEEGMSAFLEPQYAKITYDPNAQNATAQEIAYSAFVGGLAGMVMGGTASVAEKVATRRQDAKTGEELVAQGKEASILEMAREVAETERNTPTGDHAFEYTKEAYDKLMQSLATTDGKVTNDSQKRMLGEVARWSSFSAFSPMISKSAANIYQNAEAFAERLNAYYSSVGGNMSVTAEDIRNGLDPKDPKTFKTALETNPTLRMLAIADATGHLFLDSTRFAQAAAEGRGIATQDDINRLLETADEAKINALSQRYGVDLRTATASEFNKAVTQYMQSGGYDTEMGEVRRSKAAKGADEKTAKTKLPKAISLKDGETVRYKIGDEDFSITREGDGYYLHDNKTDRATRKLTKAEVNKRLADYRQQAELSKPNTGDNEQKKTAETVDAWAGENVIGYNKLGNADKVGIRRLINTARAMGVSDADIAIYASISARSGVKITFESKPDADYNGYYSHKDNLITINIAKTKSAESTIIHEFDHAIRTVDGDFYIPVKEAADALTDAEFMQVMEAYSNETAIGKADELTAHGAEKLLAGQGVLTRLMDEQPKLLDRVLAFFKGAESDYKALPRLSKEAKRYYKKYKKMYDALSYRNAGGYVAPGDAVDFRYNRAAVDTHQKTLKQKYNEKSSPVPLEKLLKGYERIVSMWDRIGSELNSEFLNRWNERKQDKAFTIFKKQSGYTYNVELSSMCKKGIPLFEAIDTIVRDEAMAKHGINQLGKAEKEVLYDVLQKHDFEIPCAICYVEQARQRENIVIADFADGDSSKGKLGWNQALTAVEERMSQKLGRKFKFGSFDQSIGTDAYEPTDVILTEEEQKVFCEALAEEAMVAIEKRNAESEEYNKKHKTKPRKILPNKVTAEGVRRYFEAKTATAREAARKAIFGGSLPANVKIFSVLMQDPNARRHISAKLLYSSRTTRNLAVYTPFFYSLFNSQGGTAGYKTKQAAIAYWGELLGQKWSSTKTREHGGIRNQSNSDFQVYQFLDYVQMYIDLTAKGFYLQAYTKSIAELKLFGKSRSKMNASLIPAVHRYYNADGTINEELTRENAGLDENGNPIYDDVEGINHTEAFALIRDPEYSKNITGICIGYSDKHILKLLDVPEVQMIIGYHDKTNDPTKRYRGAVYATNYTGRNEAAKQGEEIVSEIDTESVDEDDGGKKVKHINFTQFIIQAENLFKSAKQYDSKTDTYRGSIEHNGKTYKAEDIPKLAADLYLEMCAEKGLSPAYSRGGTDFTKHPNYYKLLADYGLKDSEGHYAPNRKVAFALPDTVPVLAADGTVSQMGTQEYLKAQLQSELEVRDRIARDLADTSENGIIPQFVKGVEQLRQEQRGGVRYTLNIAFEGELKEWFASTTQEERAKSGRRFLVGTTTDVLRSIGVKDSKIYFGGSKINKILQANASMSIDTIVGAVNLLEDPILIMESQTVEGSIIMFGEVYTDGSKPVMVSLLIDPKNEKGEILDYSVITSAYGRRASNVQGLIDRSRIYYVNPNKKRTDKWLKALGLQLPSALTTYGSIDSIPQTDPNVNPLGENSVRKSLPIDDIRYSRPVESATIGAVMTSVDEGYKAGKMETLRDAAIATQIAITNAQAGIEAYGKKHGIKDIEARVQAVRSAQGQAGEMIGGHQYRIGGATNEEKRVYLGQGLQEIMRPINDYGKGQKVKKSELKEMREAYKREFFDYLFNHLNVDRMTLESRSMDEQKARLEAQKAANADVKSLTRRYKQILAKIGKLGRTKTDLAEKKTLRAEAKDLAAQIRKLQKEMKERQAEIDAFEPRQNKPVLRKDNGRGVFTEVSADESREQIKKYDEERPEFKEIAEKLWAFLRNLNQYRVDTGLLSQDTADLLADLYAHYVPSYRADSKVGIAAIDGKRILGVRQTVKGAKGSLKDLLPIDVMIARQVEETVRAGRINQLANILYETAIDGETDEIQILSKDKVTTEEMAEFDPTSMRPKDGQITFYRDGEKIVMRVSKEIFAGFDAFTPQIDSKNPLANTLTAINNAFKKLVTSMNPAFLARNTIRDIQDAGINTKYPKTFVQNYARAAQEIMKDGELWRLYRAFGGYSSSIFDFDSGMQGHQNRFGFTQVEGNLLERGITAIENANAFTEQLPRFAEFISAIEAGKSVEQAILDAADVTTNFGRSGRVTQVLNRTLVPFLNPSIQGFSKMIRNVTSIRTAREFGSLALKVTLIGLLPQAINMLMYGGDDDYEELKDTDKENNFLFKVGDKFVKLPRGRVASALGGLVNRTASAVKGEDADWWGYVENVFQQVTPVDSMSRDIFSPFRDVQFNTTWYGSPIEGRQFDNTAPKDRYDESTSSIAKAISDGLHAIGLGFGISPKKVHYLLDQYSGVIGDFVLPATTAKPERDFLSGNFTIDPVSSNELSTKFYKLYDEAVYARTDGDDTATYQVRYLTKVKNAISDMYDRKREIERSNLSDKEKQAETRVIQILINEAYRTALADYSLYTDAVKATSGIEDANIRFAEATRLVYGAERALKDYDGEVYKRASALKAAGVDYDTYYSYYFSTKDIEADKDIRGNDISGSKRKKVVSTITAMKIPKEQKMILINAAGYAVKDGDIPGVKASTAKGILWRYIRNAKGLTEEQMEILARVCGFSVKNGKIVMNG